MPVVNVTWDDAVDYCRSIGGRLPTEAEWEYAARAGTTTKYWWGDTWDPGRARGGLARSATPSGPEPVGNPQHRNPWGLYDMIGNVLEWTSTISQSYPYSPADGREDPRSRALRTTRGGAYASHPSSVPFTYRGNSDPTFSVSSLGFRCAQSVRPGPPQPLEGASPRDPALPDEVRTISSGPPAGPPRKAARRTSVPRKPLVERSGTPGVEGHKACRTRAGPSHPGSDNRPSLRPVPSVSVG